MAALLTVILAVSVTAFFFFTLGRSTADRKSNLNHHKMMMLLMELRQRDDTVPIVPTETRSKLDGLLDEYERLDLDSDRGSVTLATVAGVAAVIVAAVIVGAVVVAALNPGPSLEEGRIEAKVYDDPDDWYQPGQVIHGSQTCTGGYGNPPSPRVCTKSPDVHIPGMWHHDPEHFVLELRGPHPDDPSKTITDTIQVPESFWNEVRVGQWVDVDSLEVIPR